MKNRLLIPSAALFVVALAVGVSLAAREGLWTLDFSHRPLQHILVQTPQGPVAYYYIPYEVANKTGEDAVTVRPNGKIVTETDQTLMATPDPKAAFEICKRLNREMLDIDAMAKEPLPKDQSRQGLFIWTGLDDRADHLDIYLYGLSSEYKYTDETNRTGFLRKVYRIKLTRPGDVENRHADKVTIEEEGWTWVPTDVK